MMRFAEHQWLTNVEIIAEDFVTGDLFQMMVAVSR